MGETPGIDHSKLGINPENKDRIKEYNERAGEVDPAADESIEKELPRVSYEEGVKQDAEASARRIVENQGMLEPEFESDEDRQNWVAEKNKNIEAKQKWLVENKIHTDALIEDARRKAKNA